MIWIARTFLAVLFLGHGVAFVVQPAPAAEMMRELPIGLRELRLLGIAEVMGAVALLALPALDMWHALYLVDIACLAVVLTGAAFVHARRREVGPTGMTVVALGVTVGLLAA